MLRNLKTRSRLVFSIPYLDCVKFWQRNVWGAHFLIEQCCTIYGPHQAHHRLVFPVYSCPGRMVRLEYGLERWGDARRNERWFGLWRTPEMEEWRGSITDIYVNGLVTLEVHEIVQVIQLPNEIAAFTIKWKQEVPESVVRMNPGVAGIGSGGAGGSRGRLRGISTSRSPLTPSSALYSPKEVAPPFPFPVPLCWWSLFVSASNFRLSHPRQCSCSTGINKNFARTSSKDFSVVD